MVYGAPWAEARVSADNPMENVERYRGKRIFLVSGTSFIDSNEKRVLPTQRNFGRALEAAGIPHERYEEAGGHFVRRERLRAGHRRCHRSSDQGRLRAVLSVSGPSIPGSWSR